MKKYFYRVVCYRYNGDEEELDSFQDMETAIEKLKSVVDCSVYCGGVVNRVYHSLYGRIVEQVYTI